MGHVGSETHHRHNEQAQAREPIGEHVADELHDIEDVAASRNRAFLGQESSYVKDRGAQQHERAARKQHERGILAPQDGPTHDNQSGTADCNAQHDYLLKKIDKVHFGESDGCSKDENGFI